VVRWVQLTLDGARHLFQHAVTSHVVVVLVELSEAVDIEEDDGDFVSVAQLLDAPLTQRVLPG
jgi:hypothetical protein